MPFQSFFERILLLYIHYQSFQLFMYFMNLIIGTLPEHIRFLLCLATPSEIWLLGMMYSNTNSNHTLRMQSSCPILEVMPDPLYCLPTENNYISCIESTPNGR